MGDLPAELNRLAGTEQLDAQGAANIIAGTSGVDLVGALNVAAGTTGLEFNGVVKKLARLRGGNSELDANSATQATQFRLKWAPPSGWQNYTSVTIPATGGTIDLAADTDYKLTQTVPRTDALHIRGGRNVVWIGGRVTISNKGASDVATTRRPLVITDAVSGSVENRIVHIEGHLYDGNDLSEGIDISAPTAIIQIQNIHCGTIHIRGADDRDGTGVYTASNHPDIIQPYGGCKEIRVDGITGKSNYQGLFMFSAVAVKPILRARRVNIEMVEVAATDDAFNYAGHRGYTWTSAESNRHYLDNGTVWLKHHANSGWAGGGPFKKSGVRSGGSIIADPVAGNSVFGDNVNPPIQGTPPYQAIIASDSIGTYAYWPSNATVAVDTSGPAIMDLTGTVAGRIYSGYPPGGDYVSAASVGLSYVSPGYES